MDLPTIEQARRLKELGLEWSPQLGDWCWSEMWQRIVLVEPLARLQKDLFSLCLPHLDQIMAEIERLIPDYKITFFNWGDDKECEVYEGIWEHNRGGETGPSDTQAAAEVLIKLMEERVK